MTKKRKRVVSKIKVLKVEKHAPDTHRVALELEVKGADDPPAIITEDQALEIAPQEDKPQLAAHGGWIDWLKSIW
jgi:hypothetical protein